MAQENKSQTILLDRIPFAPLLVVVVLGAIFLLTKEKK